MRTTLICRHQTGEYPGVQESRHIQARLLILITQHNPILSKKIKFSKHGLWINSVLWTYPCRHFQYI